MADIRRRFFNDIAARLSGAPESDAKQDMIEELAENLAGRYQDSLAGGMPEEDAYAHAMEELGDTEELTAYLISLDPDGPISDSGGSKAVNELIRAVEDLGAAGVRIGKKAVEITNQFLQSDAAKNAVEEGKKALNQVGDMLRSVTATDAEWEEAGKENDRQSHGFNIHVTEDKDPASGIDIRFSIDDREKDTGAGADTEVGADTGADMDTDAATGEEAGQAGTASFGRPQKLHVDVPGDVKICLGDENSSLHVAGDVDKLDVYLGPDGTLTIRKAQTASSQFFSLRGLGRANVVLTIPARPWEQLSVSTSGGDVEIARENLHGGLDVGQLRIHTTSGDIDCQVNSCEQAVFKTTSGDMDARGNFVSFRAETVSGDLDLSGPLGQVVVSSVSGDMALEGFLAQAKAKTVSGDIHLRSMKLPQSMDLSSRSGDITAEIPADGPFTAEVHSVSGKVDMSGFSSWEGEGENKSHFVLASISGDVQLRPVQY